MVARILEAKEKEKEGEGVDDSGLPYKVIRGPAG